MADDRASAHVRDDTALDLQGAVPQQQSTPSTPAELPLRFIDEFQRQGSSEVRREIRAHVRRNTHAKQKRLNEASKPKPLSAGQRRILQRVETPSPSRSQPGLPLLTRNSISEQPHGENDTSMDELLEMSPHEFPLSRRQFNITTPYALLLGENAPILQLDARSWPFPQPIRGDGPAISLWMPQKSIPVPDAGSPRPCLLRSAQTVPWIANSVDYYTFKSEVIQWVNERLVEPENATSDVTIGVIICLMSWEIARGNIQELKLHIDGLTRIINLRGGGLNITTVDQFCWKIALIDLLVAVLTGSKPRLSFQSQEDKLGPPPINPSIGSIQLPDSPLYGHELFDITLRGSKFCKDAVLLLQYMRDLTAGICRGNAPPIQHSIDLEPSSSSDTLDQIIYATSAIYSCAFNNPPTPLSSPSNIFAMKTISTCLEDTQNDRTWIECPGILLWVLLTALSAAVNQPEGSFFAMFVFRVGTSAAWWGPRQARAAIMTFLRVKKRSEGFCYHELHLIET